MKVLKMLKRKKSIAHRLTLFIILLIVMQSLILFTMLIIGGVITETRDKSFQSFNENVSHQKDYVLKEMSNRWTNIDPYFEEISSLFDTDERTTEQLFSDATPALISMLRTTMTNGAFIVLNASEERPNKHEAIYLRDYDPYLNDGLNNDLTCLIGPANICHEMNISFDSQWRTNFMRTNDNGAFYEQPASKSILSTNSNWLGYWSKPFKLAKNDVDIITYTVPIFDANEKFRGVLGIEVALTSFIEYLPGSDLLSRDSISYLIGYKQDEHTQITPLITNGALQTRILHSDIPLDLQVIEGQPATFLLKNHKIKDNIYVNAHPLQIYAANTPFEHEQWYMVGLMSEDKLLGLVNKIQYILAISLICSIIIGVVASFIFTRLLTKPIVSLAEQVKKTKNGEVYQLNRIGLKEIDHLSHAIEVANQNFIDSTLKLSTIINLVNVPIGAFEVKVNEKAVFATEQLKQILLVSDDVASALYEDKQAFMEFLNAVMKHAEPDEGDVYKVAEHPEKWVRITMKSDDEKTIGVVTDVTAEMLDKMQIKFERDHDVLTNIYNRGAYKRMVNSLLAQGDLKVSACIMFDLDFLKTVNDTFGHKWGDLYIKKTAEYLQTFSGRQGLVGRISGDEFSVFLYDYDSKAQIQELIVTFYETLARHPIDFPNETRSIRISGGLYWLPAHDVTYEDMIHKADEALYVAKRTQKGSLVEYDKMNSY